MILRKPYAFLIKRFKLIHLCIGFLMLFLSLRTKNIMNLLNSYIKNPSLTNIKADNYITSTMYWAVLAILVFVAIIYWLMHFKKKPTKLYLITLIGYIIVAILFAFTVGQLYILEFEHMGQKEIRFVRDIQYFTLYFQYIMTSIMLIRGMGFDIKKFNFREDIAELNIDVLDNEEFEFSVESGSNKITRYMRKNFRQIKYVFKENKLLIIMLLIILIIIIGINIYIDFFVYNKKYYENQRINTDFYTINVKNSYYSTKNYTNNIINKDKYYVVIKFLISSNTMKNLDIDRIVLKINDTSYYSNKKYCNQFTDIGICYNNQEISNSEKEYILLYEIDKVNVFNGEAALIYYDSTVNRNGRTSNKIINLNPNNVDQIVSKKEYSINDKLSFDSYVLNGSTISITNYSIKNTFTYRYKFCISNDCNEYSGVILPNYKTNKVLSVMEITGDVTGNKKISEILKYAKVGYKLNDDSNDYIMNTVNLSPKNYTGSKAYIQVAKDIIDAKEIYLKFVLRDYQYIYYLKK